MLKKSKSQRQNVWDISLHDTIIGQVEVIKLSKTTRSCRGKVEFITANGTFIEHTCDGEKPFTVSKFMKEVEEKIQSLDVSNHIQEEEVEPLFNKTIVISDVNADNVLDAIDYLRYPKPKNWERQPVSEQLSYVHSLMDMETQHAQTVPMYDLVRRSRIKGTTKATPLKVHF